MPQAITDSRNLENRGEPPQSPRILLQIAIAAWLWPSPHLPGHQPSTIHHPPSPSTIHTHQITRKEKRKHSQRSNTPRVDPDTSLEAAHRLAHLVRHEGLVALERVRIPAARVELVRALEGRHRLVVLVLQREAVADRDPCLGCPGVDVEHLLREARERRGALEVPEERRVVVKVPYPVWIERPCRLVRSFRLWMSVTEKLKVGLRAVGRRTVAYSTISKYPLPMRIMTVGESCCCGGSFSSVAIISLHSNRDICK